MTKILFINATVLDTTAGELIPHQQVLIEHDLIRAVTSEHIHVDDATIIDLAGKVLMPGLCDAHVHVTAVIPDFAQLMRWPASYTTARASVILREMLLRGFTTVRDAGGADFGLARAIEEHYIVGPRLLFSGHALSQTGGHGDMRTSGEHTIDNSTCCTGLGRICDGVTAIRQACREEIRKGAHQIKLMVSGGIVSPTDRISSTQFAIEELKAAVEEAEAAQIYVMAHAYTARAVNRALLCGVRSIEHGNLMDESSIPLFLEKKAFLVPTLSTYHVSMREGLEAGMSKETHAQIDEVLAGGLQALELAHRNGIKTVYGTDLLGNMHRHQLGEFALRSQVQQPVDIIRAATVNAAELFQLKGKIGVVAPGAYADLLVVNGNPLEDLQIWENPEENIKFILKAGFFYKRPRE